MRQQIICQAYSEVSDCRNQPQLLLEHDQHTPEFAKMGQRHIHPTENCRTLCVSVHDDCVCCGGQGMRQEVEMQVGELQSDDIHDAQDAAQVLLELLEERGGGREAAVPAAVVALDALPALRSLGAQLPTKAPVQQLLSLCCIAREKVWLPFLTSTLDNARSGWRQACPSASANDISLALWHCNCCTHRHLERQSQRAALFTLCRGATIRPRPHHARLGLFFPKYICELLCFRYRCRFWLPRDCTCLRGTPPCAVQRFSRPFIMHVSLLTHVADTNAVCEHRPEHLGQDAEPAAPVWARRQHSGNCSKAAAHHGQAESRCAATSCTDTLPIAGSGSGNDFQLISVPNLPVHPDVKSCTLVAEAALQAPVLRTALHSANNLDMFVSTSAWSVKTAFEITPCRLV